jgi:hypothetical protein
MLLEEGYVSHIFVILSSSSEEVFYLAEISSSLVLSSSIVRLVGAPAECAPEPTIIFESLVSSEI